METYSLKLIFEDTKKHILIMDLLGEYRLISSLPDKALRRPVDIARLVMNALNPKVLTCHVCFYRFSEKL